MRFITLATLAATALAAVHVVEVGESGQKFEPQTISAKVGDTVIYHFYPNHDVAQAAFDAPCVPFNGGFYSGPFSGTDSGKKKFVYNVTTTNPIWYYCTTQNHCQNGMVGGINIPTSGEKTIAAFASAAKNTNTERPAGLSGGQLEEDEQIASLTASSSGGSVSTSAPSSTGSGSPATTTSTPTGSGSASTPSSTGVADNVKAPVTGVLAAALGFAAWLL
ncbi:Cupredoxin [Lophiotrema nucula]|uniref:Cupredoxin n=1 Tax=Lophiotrema nucula TaxID=690887 RepID=A0A6A5ZHW1_9PLEO|nr:Cupredoxin [Lophiotrema nucula]